MIQMLLAAIGGRLAGEALRVARGQPLVVFGTLDEPALRRLDEERCRTGDSAVPVYFYESG
ncbi:MAG: hypothetical protein QMC81_03620 [Thermoanaerobacterales bacterium]|nr:hypothetical protein [Bacillota bacterium]MDI6906569.1 hypothetical protein [Thermoanaerobacterales bacterium]